MAEETDDKITTEEAEDKTFGNCGDADGGVVGDEVENNIRRREE